MSKPEKIDVNRLAMREEGDYWVAYYADPDTMEDAVKLGSIHIGIIQNQHFKKLFMKMMQHVVGDMFHDTTGKHPDWLKPECVPDSEGSGSL